MDNASYFMKDKALFGSFPTQKSVDELEQEGVRYFIDLTYPSEQKIEPYITKYNYMNFPITDCHSPHDWKSFACLILKISNTICNLRQKERVYVHCKGGHGRSGVVVACILCYLMHFKASKAIEFTNDCHKLRKVMREKWRTIGSPQTFVQKSFVHKFFSPLRFYRAFKNGHTGGFSNFTPYNVVINGFGTFPTAEAAIQAYKSPHDKDYVYSQQTADTPTISKLLGREVTLRSDWDKVRSEVVYFVLKCKFDQHPQLKHNLMNTGLRPIIYCFRNDELLCSNIIGEALIRIREEYYRHEI